MIGDVIEVWVYMLLLACFSFAPLAYFVYMYTMKHGEPFGNIEPHGDSESMVLDIAGNLIDKVKGFVVKK
jgi:hypothetical protein